MPDEVIGSLEENMAQLHAALTEGDLDTAARLDFAFHMQIVAVAGNGAIEAILRSSSEIMKESQRLPFYRRELLQSTYREHRAILDALKARDCEAAWRSIEAHITAAAQRAGVHFPAPTR